jgi:hypothetical protein
MNDQLGIADKLCLTDLADVGLASSSPGTHFFLFGHNWPLLLDFCSPVKVFPSSEVSHVCVSKPFRAYSRARVIVFLS